MRPDPLTLAYLAGVIDSDGHVTIHRSTRAGRRYYAARVGIAGTRRAPHDLAASLFGGRVSVHVPRSPAHRPQFQWSRTGRPAVAVIEALLPFLRVKRDQALLALQLAEHVEFGRGEDPYPWFGPDFDPGQRSEALLEELRESRTWDEFPARQAVPA